MAANSHCRPRSACHACLQSDFPAESSIAADVGTNLEGRSEAAFSRSSAQSGGASAADRDDASATDMWSTQVLAKLRVDTSCPAVIVRRAACPADKGRQGSDLIAHENRCDDVEGALSRCGHSPSRSLMVGSILCRTTRSRHMWRAPTTRRATTASCRRPRRCRATRTGPRGQRLRHQPPGTQ